MDEMISMQISNFYTRNVKAFDILNLQTTRLVKREKDTFCLYRRTSSVGYFGTVTEDKKCSEMHEDPSWRSFRVFSSLSDISKSPLREFFLADMISGAEDTNPNWFFTFGSRG